MNILGIGGIPNEASCALSRDGRVVAAVEERKLARPYVPFNLPEQAMAACLKLGGVDAAQVDVVALVRPLAAGPEGRVHLDIRARFPKSRIVVVEHHAAHAASAYYCSPFEQATVLTLDRGGDFRCGALWRGEGNRLEPVQELYYPDSLGDLYGRVTELLGFNARADEHKVMWMSSAGSGGLRGLFLEMLSLEGAAEGSWPHLDRSFFEADRLSAGGFSRKLYDRLGLAEREPLPEPLRVEAAAGVQKALEHAVLGMAPAGGNLCLAGGVGYNSLLVAALETSGKFDRVFVQPVSGNVGTALGAAAWAWHVVCRETQRAPLEDLFLGPSFQAEEIKQVLENCKLRLRYLLTGDELIDTAVKQVNDSKIVAWFHGRMEFGPRALGNRSILASPLNPYSTENLNVYIKHREPFRKFAASVPAELAGEYFDVGPNARFLATVGKVRPAHRKTFESAVLGGGWVRVHTVSERENPLYWKLLHAAGKATGLPVLYNTSFNLHGDPLVCTPRDAVRSFYSSGIDAMFAGHFLLEK